MLQSCLLLLYGVVGDTEEPIFVDWILTISDVGGVNKRGNCVGGAQQLAADS